MSPWPTVMLTLSMMDSCSLCWPCLTESLSFPPSAFFSAQAALSSSDWASLEVGRKRGPGGWTSTDKCACLPSFTGVIWKHILHVPPAELSPVTHSSNPLNSTPFIGMSPFYLLFSHPFASMSRLTPHDLPQFLPPVYPLHSPFPWSNAFYTFRYFPPNRNCICVLLLFYFCLNVRCYLVTSVNHGSLTCTPKPTAFLKHVRTLAQLSHVVCQVGMRTAYLFA